MPPAPTSPVPVQVCPHCSIALPPAWSPQHAGRCPACQLLIGAGRTTTGDGMTRGNGSAARLMVSAAHRANAPSGDPDVVARGLLAAAATLGTDVTRMPLLTYDEVSRADPALPGVDVVLSTFPTWKDARETAARLRHADLLAPAPGA